MLREREVRSFFVTKEGIVGSCVPLCNRQRLCHRDAKPPPKKKKKNREAEQLPIAQPAVPRFVLSPVSRCAVCGRVLEGARDEWHEDFGNRLAERVEREQKRFNVACCAQCFNTHDFTVVIKAQQLARQENSDREAAMIEIWK